MEKSHRQSEQAASDLKNEIEKFIQSNFPQIKMHGGSASIVQLSEPDEEVTLRLGGACSGCGISPMTIQALKQRMTEEVDGISTVHADTGSETTQQSPSFPGDTVSDGDDQAPDAPF